jgi:thymidylate synthase ThyX
MTSASVSEIAEVFESPAPVVRLVNAFDHPYDNAVATARTCYASRIIEPDDVSKDAHARAQREAIATSTYDAGHHTTLQHATFQFVLENVSRQFIWSYLHAHPFYNSEQVSQRYVAVKDERVLVPRLGGRGGQLYRETIGEQMACYRDLVEMLVPRVHEHYFALFPARRKKVDAYRRAIIKKAQEIARYALPVATFAHLYHTVSGLTLHRYHRLSVCLDVPSETRVVVAAMIEAVRAIDPLFFARIEDPIPLEETHEYLALATLGAVDVNPSARAFRETFDRELGGLASRLVSYQANAEALLARAVRSVLGQTPEMLADGEAIVRVLSPRHNPYLGGTLNLTSLGKLTRTLVHPHYTFQKKLSHTADSQDQRHRTTPGSRPVLHAQYVGGDPDVVVPELVASVPEALDRFMRTMRATWDAVDNLLADGVGPERALYLLPNAFPIRFEESGDLAGHLHKWRTRLCYNAQEEIWRATVDEVRAVRAVHPRIGRHIGPPCEMRWHAAQKPHCPEGSRFCGVPVWKLKLDDYARVL